MRHYLEPNDSGQHDVQYGMSKMKMGLNLLFDIHRQQVWQTSVSKKL